MHSTTFPHFAITRRTIMNRTRSQIVLENISGTQMYANLAIAETRPVLRHEQPP